ncbi:hypothetical protein NFI96_000692 [Prochilodus magdalenae]|nr:hypothetical protein NFI96_000692 [Prochilodus magdalenae]
MRVHKLKQVKVSWNTGTRSSPGQTNRAQGRRQVCQPLVRKKEKEEKEKKNAQKGHCSISSISSHLTACHYCIAAHSSNTIIKFADDTTIIGNITKDDEGPYREEVKLLTQWCAANNLSLSVSKSKELITDFRKGERTNTPLNIGGTLLKRVSSFKFLGVHLAEDLTWTLNTSHIIRKAQQRLHFLRRLSRVSLPQLLLCNFYRSTVESILMSCITVWYGSATSAERKALQRVVKNAQHITATACPPTHAGHLRQEMSEEAVNISSDPTHPSHPLFQPLPSGKRYQNVRVRTTREQVTSFYPRGVKLVTSKTWIKLCEETAVQRSEGNCKDAARHFYEAIQKSVARGRHSARNASPCLNASDSAHCLPPENFIRRLDSSVLVGYGGRCRDRNGVMPDCDAVTQNGCWPSSVTSPAFVLVETTNESVGGGTVVSAKGAGVGKFYSGVLEEKAESARGLLPCSYQYQTRFHYSEYPQDKERPKSVVKAEVGGKSQPGLLIPCKHWACGGLPAACPPSPPELPERILGCNLLSASHHYAFAKLLALEMQKSALRAKLGPQGQPTRASACAVAMATNQGHMPGFPPAVYPFAFNSMRSHSPFDLMANSSLFGRFGADLPKEMAALLPRDGGRLMGKDLVYLHRCSEPVKELCENIQAAWDGLSQDTIRNLYNSMLRPLACCHVRRECASKTCTNNVSSFELWYADRTVLYRTLRLETVERRKSEGKGGIDHNTPLIFHVCVKPGVHHGGREVDLKQLVRSAVAGTSLSAMLSAYLGLLQQTKSSLPKGIGRREGEKARDRERQRERESRAAANSAFQPLERDRRDQQWEQIEE